MFSCRVQLQSLCDTLDSGVWFTVAWTFCSRSSKRFAQIVSGSGSTPRDVRAAYKLIMLHMKLTLFFNEMPLPFCDWRLRKRASRISLYSQGLASIKAFTTSTKSASPYGCRSSCMSLIVWSTCRRLRRRRFVFGHEPARQSVGFVWWIFGTTPQTLLR